MEDIQDHDQAPWYTESFVIRAKPRRFFEAMRAFLGQRVIGWAPWHENTYWEILNALSSSGKYSDMHAQHGGTGYSLVRFALNVTVRISHLRKLVPVAFVVEILSEINHFWSASVRLWFERAEQDTIKAL